MNSSDNGYDFDNMSKDELIGVLKQQYIKCIKEVDGFSFKVGKYYDVCQTGEDEVCFWCDEECFMNFEKAKEHFE